MQKASASKKGLADADNGAVDTPLQPSHRKHRRQHTNGSSGSFLTAVPPNLPKFEALVERAQKQGEVVPPAVIKVLQDCCATLQHRRSITAAGEAQVHLSPKRKYRAATAGKAQGPVLPLATLKSGKGSAPESTCTKHCIMSSADAMSAP